MVDTYHYYYNGRIPLVHEIVLERLRTAVEFNSLVFSLVLLNGFLSVFCLHECAHVCEEAHAHICIHRRSLLFVFFSFFLFNFI